MKERDLEQLRGAGKMLDILWNNSYYSMGDRAADRIRKEMEYYFGKNWTKTMYDFIEDGGRPHEIIPVKTLKEIRPKKKKDGK